MLACLTRRAPAVLGKLDDFGDLMGVSRRTAWSDLEYLCSVNLLTKMPDYKVGRSYGRNGDAIEHRQQELDLFAIEVDSHSADADHLMVHARASCARHEVGQRVAEPADGWVAAGPTSNMVISTSEFNS